MREVLDVDSRRTASGLVFDHVEVLPFDDEYVSKVILIIAVVLLVVVVALLLEVAEFLATET